MHATHITTGARRKDSGASARPRGPRALRLASALALALVACIPTTAGAVSIRDLVELSRAGLSDEVLVALIEADDTDFALDAPRILELRQQGVSERVITAMLKSGRSTAEAGPGDVAQAAVAAPPGEPDPYFVVIGEKPPAPAPRPQLVLVVPWTPVIGKPPSRPQIVLPAPWAIRSRS